ncbi:hypothetical protein E3N88_42292 [Mikania micrantha]|uniref:Uncharacterized protein n=1 Tax=Mikania micrantha TaxID=192012 RepID=A0A5N6LI60_9ASTR|nr:hypothetical protein E3N88_42292 [Mikania micrantha]
MTRGGKRKQSSFGSFFSAESSGKFLANSSLFMIRVIIPARTAINSSVIRVASASTAGSISCEGRGGYGCLLGDILIITNTILVSAMIECRRHNAMTVETPKQDPLSSDDLAEDSDEDPEEDSDKDPHEDLEEDPVEESPEPKRQCLESDFIAGMTRDLAWADG